MRGGLGLPHSCSQGWLTCAIANRVSSAMLPRRGAGSAFPSVVYMGQLLCQLEAVRARREGIFSSFPSPPHCRQGGSTSYAFLVRSGLSHPCPWLQGQLYWAAHARQRACSPEGCSWWAAESGFPPAAGVEEWGEAAIFPSSTFPHERGACPAVPSSGPQGPLAHVPANWMGSILLPRSGIEPPLLSASAGEEQRYFGQPYPLCLHQGQGGSPDT